MLNTFLSFLSLSTLLSLSPNNQRIISHSPNFHSYNFLFFNFLSFQHPNTTIVNKCIHVTISCLIYGIWFTYVNDYIIFTKYTQYTIKFIFMVFLIHNNSDYAYTIWITNSTFGSTSKPSKLIAKWKLSVVAFGSTWKFTVISLSTKHTIIQLEYH